MIIFHCFVHSFWMAAVFYGTLLLHLVNCADTPPLNVNNAEEPDESPAAEWDENPQSIVQTYWALPTPSNPLPADEWDEVWSRSIPSNQLSSSVSAQFSTAAAGTHPPLPTALQRPSSIPLRGTHQSAADIPSSSRSLVPMPPVQHATAAVGFGAHQPNEASTSASGLRNSASQQAAAAAGISNPERVHDILQRISLAGANATPAQRAFHQQQITQRRIYVLEKQLAELDKPGERYNFRPVANIFFALYGFINCLTRNHPFAYPIYEEAQKMEFITSQFTEHKFARLGQFRWDRWIDPAGRDVFSILLTNYPLARPFNVQVYEAIPIDEYNEARYYTEANEGKINIHSFLEVFIRERTRCFESHLRDELFPAIEKNCAGESKFNLCIIQHVMCFGVQLHYNLQLLKAYTLRVHLGMLKTTNMDLLNWNDAYHNRRRITYVFDLEFYVDSIRSKFYAQWMQETAETITRQKDIKLIPNHISVSGSLKAQIEHKMATIRNKYEYIAVKMIEAVNDCRKRRRGE